VGLEHSTKSFIKNFFNKKTKETFTFDTHYNDIEKKNIVNIVYPITSFYERTGSLILIDNLIRQHNKVINVNEKYVYNIESYYLY